MEDFALVEPHDRNLVRTAFLSAEQPPAAIYGISDDVEFRESVVMQLRNAKTRYPADHVIAYLIQELRHGSADSRDSGSVTTCGFHHP